MIIMAEIVIMANLAIIAILDIIAINAIVAIINKMNIIYISPLIFCTFLGQNMSDHRKISFLGNPEVGDMHMQ